MAQAIEVTEKAVNGKTHQTAITKSYNTALIETVNNLTVVGGDDAEVFLGGRATKDVRTTNEDQATIDLLMNAAPTTDIEKGLLLTVKAKDGQLESNTTPYVKIFGKAQVVEFFADPNDATDSFVITRYGKNNAERSVYLVDETYAAIKALWLL